MNIEKAIRDQLSFYEKVAGPLHWGFNCQILGRTASGIK